MRRLFAFLACSAFSFASPAYATGTIECSAADGSGAQAFVSIGRLPVLGVLGATLSGGGMTFSTNEAVPGATRIVFGQGFDDGSMTRIDFTDDNINEIVASLRLVRDYDGKAGAEAGIMTIVGTGVYALTCERG